LFPVIIWSCLESVYLCLEWNILFVCLFHSTAVLFVTVDLLQYSIYYNHLIEGWQEILTLSEDILNFVSFIIPNKKRILLRKHTRNVIPYCPLNAKISTLRPPTLVDNNVDKHIVLKSTFAKTEKEPSSSKIAVYASY